MCVCVSARVCACVRVCVCMKERDEGVYSRTVPTCCFISLGIVLLRFLSCTLRPKSPNLMELLERKMLAPS